MVACRLIWRCRAESEWIRSEVASSPGPEGRRPLRALHQQTVVEVRAPWPLHTAQKYSMRSLYKDRLLQRGNALHGLPWGCLCCTRSRALYMIWLCQWWLRGVTSGFTLIQLISQCVHGSAHLYMTFLFLPLSRTLMFSWVNKTCAETLKITTLKSSPTGSLTYFLVHKYCEESTAKQLQGKQTHQSLWPCLTLAICH